MLEHERVFLILQTSYFLKYNYMLDLTGIKGPHTNQNKTVPDVKDTCVRGCANIFGHIVCNKCCLFRFIIHLATKRQTKTLHSQSHFSSLIVREWKNTEMFLSSHRPWFGTKSPTVHSNKQSHRGTFIMSRPTVSQWAGEDTEDPGDQKQPRRSRTLAIILKLGKPT